MRVKVTPGYFVLPDPLVNGLVGNPDLLVFLQISADLLGRPFITDKPAHLLFNPLRGVPVPGQTLLSLLCHLVSQAPGVTSMFLLVTTQFPGHRCRTHPYGLCDGSLAVTIFYT